MWASPRVVIDQSGVHIGREADIEVRRGVRVLQDIDKSLVPAMDHIDGKPDAWERNLEMAGISSRGWRGEQFPQAIGGARWLFQLTLAA